MRAIDTDRYDVVPVGITRDGEWVLVASDPERLALRPGQTPEVTDTGETVVVPMGRHDRELSLHAANQPPRAFGEVDVVFPLLHGPFGEDGTIQGMLDLADIRYVGSGVFASAAMMDKHQMKVVFEAAGIPVGPYVVITDKEWRRDPDRELAKVESLTYPVFVKPARAGSSMGITRVSEAQGLREAIEAAREHDPKVIVEHGIPGREIECGVLEGRGAELPRASRVGEIVVTKGHDFYDFEAKYLAADDVRLSCPAEVPPEIEDRIRTLAGMAFDAAGCEGLARCDFFYTDDGEVVINEINTMPGFTPTSMFPVMWAATGFDYPALIDELIQLALERKVGLR